MKKLDKEGMLRKYKTTFAELSADKPLSPIIGTELVTLRQVEEYCGAEHDTFQRARQKAKADLDVLEARTDTAKHVGTTVAGAQKTERYGYILPLEDGGSTEIPCGRYSYFTAAAVARLVDELQNRHVEEPGQGTAVPMMWSYNGTDVRTIEMNGEVWWVANDICDVFGETNRARAMACLATDEKGYTQMTTPGGIQSMAVVNESGLYSILFAMRPSKARKLSDESVKARIEQLNQFKRWVTHDVLPSIRKTGGYITGQESLSDEELLAKAVLVAKKTIAAREARISELEVQSKNDRPKVEFAEAVSGSKKSITVGDFAKLVYGMTGMGRNTLFRWMRDRGILQKDGNVPYQRYLKDGYFELAEQFKYGHLVKTPLITGAGQAFLFQRLQSEFGSSRPGVQ